jgi:hypothetical protein
MIAEIENCDEVMKKDWKYKTDLYRPPFGVTNPILPKPSKKLIKQASDGMSVLWTPLLMMKKNLQKNYQKLKKEALSPSRYFGKNVSCTGRFISIFGG